MVRMNKEEICYMSAWEMGEKIKTQELSSLEITEMIIERIEKINPIINAYCTTTFDLARDMAKKADEAVKRGEKLGLLHGIPTSIKDLMLTEGIRTTYGSKLYENFVPERDEVAVKRLKKAGIVLLGKTNTPEFGHVTITDNLVFGETKNPWNIERTSGGSSGGAAAATAAGISPLSLGSDGGGSIRVPSCLCGVFGFKSTYGKIPRYPRRGTYFYTIAHYGPITRFVKDAALMFNVLKGPHGADRQSLPEDNIDYIATIKSKPSKLKIGYSLGLGVTKVIEDEVEQAVLESIRRLEQFGWVTEKANVKLKKVNNAFYSFACIGAAYDYGKKLEEWRDRITPGFVKQITIGLTTPGIAYQMAWDQRLGIDEEMYKFFKNYDILITPTTAVPAFELGKVHVDKIKGKAVSHAGWYAFTPAFNLTGLPAASIPCGWTSEGLPVGMQIIGKRFDDALVFQVSKVFEEVAPWQDKRPKFD